MNDKEFIELLSKEIDSIPDFPVLKSLAISQACLESAFGRKHFYNNLFGIKCRDPKKYAGCRLGKTQEYIGGSYGNYKLAFQCYNNFRESLQDYADLMRIARYKPVREARNYIEATDQIRKCGYATSPTYTQNLRKIIEDYKLYELDYIDTNQIYNAIIGGDMKLKILKKGSKGNQVKWVQEILEMEYGFENKGEFDGIYGSLTEAQIKEYQKAYGLKQDGVVGIETMYNLIAKSDNPNLWFYKLCVYMAYE